MNKDHICQQEFEYYLQRLENISFLLGIYSERIKINPNSEYAKQKRNEYNAKKQRILYKVKQLYTRGEM